MAFSRSAGRLQWAAVISHFPQERTMSKVRIGFVGVGGMGQMAHLRNYVTIEDCQVVALAEPRATTAELVAARYGVPKVYGDHREMLAAEELDGVVATQPFQFHHRLLPEIYPHAKYLFTEKPLAATVAEGEKLVRAAADADCVHMVGYHKLSDPATLAALAQIARWRDSGEMGRTTYVRITMPPGDWISGGFIGLLDGGDAKPPRVDEPPDAAMDEPTWREYVAFVNYYIHQVNLLRHLMGEPYRVTFADRAGVLLAAESEGGVTGVLEMSPYRTTVGWEESALVAFEKGCIRLELPPPLARTRAGEVEFYADPGEGAAPQRTRPTLPSVHAMRQQAIHFVKVCRGEMPPPETAAGALRDLRVAREYVRMHAGTK